MRGELYFDLTNIYTVIHKTEEDRFDYKCQSRAWDGFVVITSGECYVTFSDSDERALSVGDALILRKGEKYSIRSKAGCSYYTSAFDFTEESEPSVSLMPKIVSCTGAQLKSFERLTADWQRRSDNSYMLCKIRLLRLCVDFSDFGTQRTYNGNRGVDRAVDFIHSNFKRQFSCAELAEYCSLSESHLRKLFLQKTGMTVIEYRDLLRLEAAKELLSSGMFSVKEAAYELGFCDVYYFTKFFVANTGITPAAFRVNYNH